MKPSIIDTLIFAGQQAPSADNSQPWRFCPFENKIAVEYDAERLAGMTFGPNEPATLMSIGGVLENMLQAADFIGAQVDWRLGDETEVQNGSPYFTLTLDHGADQLDAGLPFSEHPLFGRHTNRFPYRTNPIPSEITADVDKLRVGKASIKLLNTPREIQAIASVARQASEVRFQTREVHEWLARSLRFTRQEAAKGDGLDLATLPLPPGGAMFMRFIMDWKWMSRLNRLGAYKLMAALDVKLLEQAPAVISLVGGSSSEALIEAGRLLNRVWMELNSKGIAVHPYFVISDQLQRRRKGNVPTHLISQVDKIAGQTATLLNLPDNQHLHMLLRIGYPTRNPVRSKRLPLDAVCHGAST